jgi:hypothetical protein
MNHNYNHDIGSEHIPLALWAKVWLVIFLRRWSELTGLRTIKTGVDISKYTLLYYCKNALGLAEHGLLSVGIEPQEEDVRGEGQEHRKLRWKGRTKLHVRRVGTWEAYSGRIQWKKKPEKFCLRMLETSCNYSVQLIRFHLKTNSESSLRNVIFMQKTGKWIMSKLWYVCGNILKKVLSLCPLFILSLHYSRVFLLLCSISSLASG